MAASGMRKLHRLAKLYGIQTAYYDVNKTRQVASAEALLAVLKAMGAPVETHCDVPEAIEDFEQARMNRSVDPVLVAWEGRPNSIELRIPQRLAGIRLSGHIDIEGAEAQNWEWNLGNLNDTGVENIRGNRYVSKQLPVQGPLPRGYHKLALDIPGRSAEAAVVSAPAKAYSPVEESNKKRWGVFLPLYSLKTQNSLGTGTFSDLETLIEWVSSLGGSAVATLPMLAAFLDKPFESSPYSPVSRLMWNEFYVDITRAPVAKASEAAQNMMSLDEFKKEAAYLKSMPLVDYRSEMALKRRVLETLSKESLADETQRTSEFGQFLRDNPLVQDYAVFRAVCEKRGDGWTKWPEPMCGGRIGSADYDEDAKKYHAYVQWVAHKQMDALSRKADQQGAGLYLDLPIGVHPEGFDVWRNQQLFAMQASVGAPPDSFFTLGQNWGFPPIHPLESSSQGHTYIRDVLRHHFAHAGVLRIDHVMGLHRLYWIPKGSDARDGVYVRYPAGEVYAILCLESHRQHCWVIGENLGTVPSYVNAAMSRHGLGRMFVAQFETTNNADKALRQADTNSVSNFNTHDMPTFASFWAGKNIDSNTDMGLLDAAGAEEEKVSLRKTKQALVDFLELRGFLKDGSEPEAVHAACMSYLATQPSRLELVSLEDLWQEEQPQNVPGTGQEHPNWRRKAKYSMEEFIELPQVVEVLSEINRLRYKETPT